MPQAFDIPPPPDTFPRHSWPQDYVYGPIVPASAVPFQTVRWAARVASLQWGQLLRSGCSQLASKQPDASALLPFAIIPPLDIVNEQCFTLAVADKAIELNLWKSEIRQCKGEVFDTVEEWREDANAVLDEVYDKAVHALPPHSPCPPPLAAIRQTVREIVDFSFHRGLDAHERWPTTMPRTYFPHALVEAFTPLNYRLPKPSKPISTPVSNPSLEAARESKIPLRDSRRCNRQSERKSKLLKAADSARAVDKRLRRVAGQMAQMNLAS